MKSISRDVIDNILLPYIPLIELYSIPELFYPQAKIRTEELSLEPIEVALEKKDREAIRYILDVSSIYRLEELLILCCQYSSYQLAVELLFHGVSLEELYNRWINYAKNHRMTLVDLFIYDPSIFDLVAPEFNSSKSEISLLDLNSLLVDLVKQAGPWIALDFLERYRRSTGRKNILESYLAIIAKLPIWNVMTFTGSLYPPEKRKKILLALQQSNLLKLSWEIQRHIYPNSKFPFERKFTKPKALYMRIGYDVFQENVYDIVMEIVRRIVHIEVW